MQFKWKDFKGWSVCVCVLIMSDLGILAQLTAKEAVC